jgi:tryptophan synthase alpha chain
VLETYLRNKLDEKEILLMTHIVLGYPSFDDSFRIIEAMVEAGVDLMDLLSSAPIRGPWRVRRA